MHRDAEFSSAVCGKEPKTDPGPESMSRILLIHWNTDEAQHMVGRLCSLGHEASYHADQSSSSMRRVREDPPDAFVIDLNRLPSHGLAVATWLRQQKKTRHLPIIFIRGDTKKTERVRGLLPDAVYTSWDSLEDDLVSAVANPPQSPVVPGTMDSYSATPLAKKLGIKAGVSVVLIDPPPGFEKTLGALPKDVELLTGTQATVPIVLLFVTSQHKLKKRFQAAANAVSEGGRLWIAWPKKASGLASDLTQREVRSFGMNAGFVDYKISAIDQTWSGLCFARREAR
jgi:CheY-like chemotaxis protein